MQSLLIGHTDHINKDTLKTFNKWRVPIYSTKEASERYECVNHITTRKNHIIGGFKVYPFELHHNVECYGFLITCSDGNRILFATDTSIVPYKFKDVHHLLIEANYSDEVVERNASQDQWAKSAFENHMEINTSIKCIKQNFSGVTQNIVLLHLSSTNSNEIAFIEATKKAIGFNNVVVAKKGLQIELNTSEF